MIDALRPVFATLAPSAMRMELVRLVSERLELERSLAERVLAAGPGTGLGGGRGASGGARGGRGDEAREGGARERGGRGTDAGNVRGAGSFAARGAPTERAFLALCIASPGAGAQALAELDVAESFTSDVVRRAAQHLRAHLTDPQSGLGGDDPELSALIAQLVVQAGGEARGAEMLEVQRLQLELARMERQIRRTRAGRPGEVSELARRRSEVKRDFERAYARVLEETGERQG
jgi:DNA primase